MKNKDFEELLKNEKDIWEFAKKASEKFNENVSVEVLGHIGFDPDYMLTFSVNKVLLCVPQEKISWWIGKNGTRSKKIMKKFKNCHSIDTIERIKVTNFLAHHKSSPLRGNSYAACEAREFSILERLPGKISLNQNLSEITKNIKAHYLPDAPSHT